jgi:hypothetical protein
MIEYLGIDYPDADALISRQYHNTISLYLDECDPKLIGPTFAAWKAAKITWHMQSALTANIMPRREARRARLLASRTA